MAPVLNLIRYLYVYAHSLTFIIQRIQSDFVGPYREMLKTAAPEFVQSQPFRYVLAQCASQAKSWAAFISFADALTIETIQFGNRVSLKEVVLAYGLEKMFKDVIPNLKHGSDGLIFTSSVAPYVPSTNSKM